MKPKSIWLHRSQRWRREKSSAIAVRKSRYFFYPIIILSVKNTAETRKEAILNEYCHHQENPICASLVFTTVCSPLDRPDHLISRRRGIYDRRRLASVVTDRFGNRYR